MEVWFVLGLLVFGQLLSAGWSFVHHHRRTMGHSLLFAAARLAGGFAMVFVVGLIRAANSRRGRSRVRQAQRQAILRWPTRSELPIVLVMGTLGVAVNEVSKTTNEGLVMIIDS